MYRRMFTLGLGTSCLIVILTAGAGLWGIHQGLIYAPAGVIHLGQIDVMDFTEVEYSTANAPRAYYTIWVTVAKDPTPSARPWRPLLWAHRLIRVRVPPSAVLKR